MQSTRATYLKKNNNNNHSIQYHIGKSRLALAPCCSIHNLSTLQFGSAADLRSGEPREWAYTERPNGDYRYYERRHFRGTTDSYLDEFTNVDKTVYGQLCPPPPPCRPWWLPFSQVNIR